MKTPRRGLLNRLKPLALRIGLLVLASILTLEVSGRVVRHTSKEQDCRDFSELMLNNVKSWAKSAEAHVMLNISKRKYQDLLEKEPDNREYRQRLQRIGTQLAFLDDMLPRHKKIIDSCYRILESYEQRGFAIPKVLRNGLDKAEIEILDHEMGDGIEKYYQATTN